MGSTEKTLKHIEAIERENDLLGVRLGSPRNAHISLGDVVDLVEAVTECTAEKIAKAAREE